MSEKSAARALVSGFCAAALLVCAGAWADEGARKDAPLSPSLAARVRLLPIQHSGRTKAFDSFAWETLQQITGQDRWQGQDPVQTVISLMAWADEWSETELLSVPFQPLREQIGLGEHARHVSMSQLVTEKALMRLLPAIAQKQQDGDKLTMLENETMDAYGRFVSLNRIFAHDIAIVPPPDAVSPVWVSIVRPEGYPAEQQQALREVWNSFILAVRQGVASEQEAAFAKLEAHLRSLNPSAAPEPWRLKLEAFYNSADPFSLARWAYALAALLLLASFAGGPARASAAGGAVFALAVAFHVLGMGIRVAVGGRPPVSNFFETMLWLPFVGVVTASVFDRVYKVSFCRFAAAILSAIVLTLAEHVPLDPSITPIVAVLRSNLWLTIHVLTIVASYGALALAVVLAHIDAVLFLGRGVHPLRSALSLLTYRALQVGVVLLAGGIMLGAVWANASWGRYWGWDPKETWALITLLWYLALLHGRYAGWIQGPGLSLATIGGFFLLLMTYYGVSFYLVGLHSYAGGNAKPLPTLLVVYLIAEVVFMSIVGFAALSRGRKPA